MDHDHEASAPLPINRDEIFTPVPGANRVEQLDAETAFKLPTFTPFLVVAGVLVAIWLALFLTAPKHPRPQHLHLCKTEGPDAHTSICLH
ncbi:hypothetical protein HK13_11245 [Acetobacter indonesiensis]|uniref:hypothetical protein n=1 Tax=Acetobacter indonesiensis TaxID=104101 RepID=UPI000A38FABA|nr:hypothetical protein [Acetobacter indonesiensis]MCG0995372.1 hypothetical protein [Acetobacter indonesiensis]OUI91072.1 hypothetical protein HK13_11245 [Acetobacter indonesiensis]